VHVETARWTRETLDGLELPPGARALDVGSSTLHYRTVEQPHIEREVMAPLRRRGVRLTHLDAKTDPGVDVVCDLNAAPDGLAPGLGSFDLVLACAVLQYLDDPDRGLDLIAGAVAPGGWLVCHHPISARRTFDPVDNRLRLRPDAVAKRFESRGLTPVRADAVRIDDPRYYKGVVSRPSWMPVRGRLWLPMPGATDRIRLRVPALRWRQSCVVMRRPPGGVSSPS
jgi:SAM-dependent methyltransferase